MSDDFFAWLNEGMKATGELVEAAGVEVTQTPKNALTPQKSGRTGLQVIREQLLTGAVRIVEDAQAFTELDPQAIEPPPEWIAQLGEERAWQRFRTARYALMSAKEAPIGLQMAQRTMVGIVAAEAKQPTKVENTLNVYPVGMPLPIPRNQ